MIRNWAIFAAAFVSTFAFLSAAEQPAKPAAKKVTQPSAKSAPTKSATTKSTATKSATPKSAASKSGKPKSAPVAANRPSTATKTGKSTKSKGSARPAAVVRRYRQTQPTPDRYREIQEALAAKGYLKSEPNGVWDAQSVEAMKQFQADKKLLSSGKVTAPALIELGLGPKNEPMGAPPGLSTDPRPSEPQR